MDDVEAILGLRRDGVPHQGQVLELGELLQALQVGEVLQRVARQDQGLEVGQARVEVLRYLADLVVVDEEHG